MTTYERKEVEDRYQTDWLPARRTFTAWVADELAYLEQETRREYHLFRAAVAFVAAAVGAPRRIKLGA